MIVVDSPREGGRGSVMEKGVPIVGQETSRGVVADTKGREDPPLPSGAETSARGDKQPVELEKQLNGGGVFDGVGVQVEVREDAAEGEDRGVGVANCENRALCDGRAEKETQTDADSDSPIDAEWLAVWVDCMLCDGCNEGVDMFDSK